MLTTYLRTHYTSQICSFISRQFDITLIIHRLHQPLLYARKQKRTLFFSAGYSVAQKIKRKNEEEKKKESDGVINPHTTAENLRVVAVPSFRFLFISLSSSFRTTTQSTCSDCSRAHLSSFQQAAKCAARAGAQIPRCYLLTVHTVSPFWGL